MGEYPLFARNPQSSAVLGLVSRSESVQEMACLVDESAALALVCDRRTCPVSVNQALIDGFRHHDVSPG
jgi:hypothetical protein